MRPPPPGGVQDAAFPKTRRGDCSRTLATPSVTALAGFGSHEQIDRPEEADEPSRVAAHELAVQVEERSLPAERADLAAPCGHDVLQGEMRAAPQVLQVAADRPEAHVPD